ncbi:hypothetical protein [Moorena sp. SIO3I6]|uniref:salt stress protein, Slr1339 family n=1 Tax=Moorena sp. SIO3I6 TaxID=2607831 RepID=UPI0025DAD024|nr:hypothetical protein [Moorena sp. SIO3I6]
MDDLLAQLKAEYEQKDAGVQPQEKPLFQEKLVDLPLTDPATSASPSKIPDWVSTAEDRELAEMRTEFEKKDQEEVLKQQQELEAEQKRVQQQKQREREALNQQATEWLKGLTPNSAEGLWFEEFSDSYPSKLEAAIDYLQALKETRS